MKRLIIILLFCNYSMACLARCPTYNACYAMHMRDLAEIEHITLHYAPELASDKEFYDSVFGTSTVCYIHWQLIRIKKDLESISNNDVIPNISEWIIAGLGYDHIGCLETASEIADLCWMISDHFHSTGRNLLRNYTVPPHPGNRINRYPIFEDIAHMIAKIMYDAASVKDIYFDSEMGPKNSLDLLITKINAIDYAILVRKEAIKFQETTEKFELGPVEYLRKKLLVATDNFFSNAIQQMANIVKEAREKSLSVSETLESMPNHIIIASRVADYFMLWMEKS